MIFIAMEYDRIAYATFTKTHVYTNIFTYLYALIRACTPTQTHAYMCATNTKVDSNWQPITTAGEGAIELKHHAGRHEYKERLQKLYYLWIVYAFMPFQRVKERKLLEAFDMMTSVVGGGWWNALRSAKNGLVNFDIQLKWFNTFYLFLWHLHTYIHIVPTFIHICSFIPLLGLSTTLRIVGIYINICTYMYVVILSLFPSIAKVKNAHPNIDMHMNVYMF